MESEKISSSQEVPEESLQEAVAALPETEKTLAELREALELLKTPIQKQENTEK